MLSLPFWLPDLMYLMFLLGVSVQGGFCPVGVLSLGVSIGGFLYVGLYPGEFSVRGVSVQGSLLGVSFRGSL